MDLRNDSHCADLDPARDDRSTNDRRLNCRRAAADSKQQTANSKQSFLLSAACRSIHDARQ
jgi:hypothetical protein